MSPLSAITRAGRVRGRPMLRGTRMVLIVAGNMMVSAT